MEDVCKAFIDDRERTIEHKNSLTKKPENSRKWNDYQTEPNIDEKKSLNRKEGEEDGKDTQNHYDEHHAVHIRHFVITVKAVQHKNGTLCVWSE